MSSTSLFDHLFDHQLDRVPLTVSELNAEVRRALEGEFSEVWVEGEVTGFTRAASGHWYFCLNDGSSQIKAVCWKGTNYRIRFRPENGLSVRVRGRLSLYEPRGEFQLVVESLDPSGEGALRAAFDQIKARLEADGLFDAAIKRPIPFFPRKIAVITSPTGAAYHDIHNVLTRRARSVNIILIPTIVQGEGAADKIRTAIGDVNSYNRLLDPLDRIDVLIVGRGGGSPEDLWAYNDEALARAVRASEIPVISAVGHEIDWTICDWAADLRAPTPSAAAEVVAQREDDIDSALCARAGQLESLIEYKLLMLSSRLTEDTGSLQHAFEDKLSSARSDYSCVSSRMSHADLATRVSAARGHLDNLERRRAVAVGSSVGACDESLNILMAKLNAMSPLAVLTRGYSIVQTEAGLVLRDPDNVKPGDKLLIRLERGKLNASVSAS